MATTKAQTQSIYLVGGGDEYSIKEAAAKLAEKLAPKNAGEFGVEIIDGAVANQDEALKVFGRLREALQTVGLFGGGEKLVWLKNTDLLADNQTTRAEAVKEAVTNLTDLLKQGLPEGVVLLISAIGLDRRKSIFKTIEKAGEVQFFEAIDETKAAGEEEIASFIKEQLEREGKKMDDSAVQKFREMVAPNLREIAAELEKLFIYVGKRPAITTDDVQAICSLTRQAIIWELTDSLGGRNARKSFAALENLLGAGESAIGVVMMLAGQFRLILLAKDLIERRLLTARSGPGGNFEFVKAFERLPEQHTAHLPKTKEGKLPNAWRFYRCALAAKNFSKAELIAAMETLVEANQQLTSTQLDERLVLEQAIYRIARKTAA